eukprot:g4740.t1
MPIRRRGGIAALKAKKLALEKAKKAGESLEEERIEHVEKVVSEFKKNLEVFAKKHRDDINRDPEFRRDFQVLCQNIGVDPLASSKGFWADLLGLNDFYYELGVQIVDVCLTTRNRNGGLLALPELLRRLHAMRTASTRKVSKHDVVTAISKLKRLGGGFKVVEQNGVSYVRSVPSELSTEQSKLLDLGKANGGVISQDLVEREMKWTSTFAEYAISTLVREGIVWVDLGEGGKDGDATYWFPSQFRRQCDEDDGGA